MCDKSSGEAWKQFFSNILSDFISLFSLHLAGFLALILDRVARCYLRSYRRMAQQWRTGPQGGLNQPHANKIGEGKENLLYDFVSFVVCFEQGLWGHEKPGKIHVIKKLGLERF